MRLQNLNKHLNIIPILGNGMVQIIFGNYTVTTCTAIRGVAGYCVCPAVNSVCTTLVSGTILDVQL